MGAGGREILPKLNGRKRLILGNHDNGKDQNLHAAFQKISIWRMFPEFGALLSHVPLHPSALKPGMVNVHGHIHNRQSPTEFHINASVEAIGYRPIELETLLAENTGGDR
jgi:calcineurin-like phosphoesterase family protein